MEQIWDLLLKEQEISWKTILYDLIKSEQMDPWDVDITLLTRKYIETIRSMPEHDLKVSGKIVLAAAILLKLKSAHYVDNDFSKFDALLNPQEDFEDIEEELYMGIEGTHSPRRKDQYTLIPRNPQPRNRKVSITDLVNALQHAMTSKKRVLAKIKPTKFTLPKRNVDIMGIIEDVFHKITYYTGKSKDDKITFSKLLPPKAGREEKVYTFLPLLHLENHKKIEMNQAKPFAEIHVGLAKKKKAKAK